MYTTAATSPRPIWSHLFIINERTGYLDGTVSLHMSGFTVCVPIIPDDKTKDAVHFPAVRALGILYCGEYSGMPDAWLKLGKEVRERNLVPAEYPHTIGVVVLYIGRVISAAKQCTRIALSVKTN